MFLGHGLIAFAIAASVALTRGWSREQAWAVALSAGLFATLPDIDMLYAIAGLLGGLEGVFVTSDTFWSVANEIHRGATHSLVVGAVATLGFTAWRARADRRLGGLATLALLGLVAGVTAVGGVVVGAVMAAFVLCGLGIVAVTERFGLGPRAVCGAAALGLLYPLDVTLLSGQIILHPDPTLHLLGAFFLELATVWAGLVALALLRDVRVRDHVNPRATLGVGYAGAIFAIPAPTVEVASPFVFSVLAVGLVGIPFRAGARDSDLDTEDRVLTAITTGLVAVTLAALAYAVAYLFVLA